MCFCVRLHVFERGSDVFENSESIVLFEPISEEEEEEEDEEGIYLAERKKNIKRGLQREKLVPT